MINDLEQFSVEGLAEIISDCTGEIYNTPTSDETTVSTRVLLSLARIALAAKSANSPVIPDGWKLVPIEPTEAMLQWLVPAISHEAEINRDEYDRSGRNEQLAKWIYKSMVKKSPAPEAL